MMLDKNVIIVWRLVDEAMKKCIHKCEEDSFWKPKKTYDSIIRDLVSEQHVRGCSLLVSENKERRIQGWCQACVLVTYYCTPLLNTLSFIQIIVCISISPQPNHSSSNVAFTFLDEPPERINLNSKFVGYRLKNIHYLPLYFHVNFEPIFELISNFTHPSRSLSPCYYILNESLS